MNLSLEFILYKVYTYVVDRKDLITISSAADMAGVTRKTIYAWIELGRLDEVRIDDRPFVQRSELEKAQLRRPRKKETNSGS